MLADYDQHCQADVIELDRDSFRTIELPVRLLNAEDQRKKIRSAEIRLLSSADGAGLHQFAQVFFNASHTLAAVKRGAMWCGSQCGNWTWVVLRRRLGPMGDAALGSPIWRFHSQLRRRTLSSGTSNRQLGSNSEMAKRAGYYWHGPPP